ncbi:MAG: integrase, partial [Micrococcales bacterium]
MPEAMIDRYPAPSRAEDPLRGKPATKLRTAISIRKAGDDVEA